MAFMIQQNDLRGILFLFLLTLPSIATTNYDCYGKAFHCLNSTHFMICVDLGIGISSTIDDYIIPCPPSTVCHPDNNFECEFPVTTIAPFIETNEPTSAIQIVNEEITSSTEASNVITSEQFNTLSPTTLVESTTFSQEFTVVDNEVTDKVDTPNDLNTDVNTTSEATVTLSPFAEPESIPIAPEIPVDNEVNVKINNINDLETNVINTSEATVSLSSLTEPESTTIGSTIAQEFTIIETEVTGKVDTPNDLNTDVNTTSEATVTLSPFAEPESIPIAPEVPVDNEVNVKLNITYDLETNVINTSESTVTLSSLAEPESTTISQEFTLIENEVTGRVDISNNLNTNVNNTSETTVTLSPFTEPEITTIFLKVAVIETGKVNTTNDVNTSDVRNSSEATVTLEPESTTIYQDVTAIDNKVTDQVSNLTNESTVLSTEAPYTTNAYEFTKPQENINETIIISSNTNSATEQLAFTNNDYVTTTTYDVLSTNKYVDQNNITQDEEFPTTTNANLEGIVNANIDVITTSVPTSYTTFATSTNATELTTKNISNDQGFTKSGIELLEEVTVIPVHSEKVLSTGVPNETSSMQLESTSENLTLSMSTESIINVNADVTEVTTDGFTATDVPLSTKSTYVSSNEVPSTNTESYQIENITNKPLNEATTNLNTESKVIINPVTLGANKIDIILTTPTYTETNTILLEDKGSLNNVDGTAQTEVIANNSAITSAPDLIVTTESSVILNTNTALNETVNVISEQPTILSVEETATNTPTFVTVTTDSIWKEPNLEVESKAYPTESAVVTLPPPEYINTVGSNVEATPDAPIFLGVSTNPMIDVATESKNIENQTRISAVPELTTHSYIPPAETVTNIAETTAAPTFLVTNNFIVEEITNSKIYTQENKNNTSSASEKTTETLLISENTGTPNTTDFTDSPIFIEVTNVSIVKPTTQSITNTIENQINIPSAPTEKSVISAYITTTDASIISEDTVSSNIADSSDATIFSEVTNNPLLVEGFESKTNTAEIRINTTPVPELTTDPSIIAEDTGIANNTGTTVKPPLLQVTNRYIARKTTDSKIITTENQINTSPVPATTIDANITDTTNAPILFEDIKKPETVIHLEINTTLVVESPILEIISRVVKDTGSSNNTETTVEPTFLQVTNNYQVENTDKINTPSVPISIDASVVFEDKGSMNIEKTTNAPVTLEVTDSMNNKRNTDSNPYKTENQMNISSLPSITTDTSTIAEATDILKNIVTVTDPITTITDVQDDMSSNSLPVATTDKPSVEDMNNSHKTKDETVALNVRDVSNSFPESNVPQLPYINLFVPELPSTNAMVSVVTERYNMFNEITTEPSAYLTTQGSLNTQDVTSNPTEIITDKGLVMKDQIDLSVPTETNNNDLPVFVPVENVNVVPDIFNIVQGKPQEPKSMVSNNISATEHSAINEDSTTKFLYQPVSTLPLHGMTDDMKLYTSNNPDTVVETKSTESNLNFVSNKPPELVYLKTDVYVPVTENIQDKNVLTTNVNDFIDTNTEYKPDNLETINQISTLPILPATSVNDDLSTNSLLSGANNYNAESSSIKNDYSNSEFGASKSNSAITSPKPKPMESQTTEIYNNVNTERIPVITESIANIDSNVGVKPSAANSYLPFTILNANAEGEQPNVEASIIGDVQLTTQDYSQDTNTNTGPNTVEDNIKVIANTESPQDSVGPNIGFTTSSNVMNYDSRSLTTDTNHPSDQNHIDVQNAIRHIHGSSNWPMTTESIIGINTQSPNIFSVVTDNVPILSFLSTTSLPPTKDSITDYNSQKDTNTYETTPPVLGGVNPFNVLLNINDNKAPTNIPNIITKTDRYIDPLATNVHNKQNKKIVDSGTVESDLTNNANIQVSANKSTYPDLSIVPVPTNAGNVNVKDTKNIEINGDDKQITTKSLNTVNSSNTNPNVIKLMHTENYTSTATNKSQVNVLENNETVMILTTTPTPNIGEVNTNANVANVEENKHAPVLDIIPKPILNNENNFTIKMISASDTTIKQTNDQTKTQPITDNNNNQHKGTQFVPESFIKREADTYLNTYQGNINVIKTTSQLPPVKVSEIQVKKINNEANPSTSVPQVLTESYSEKGSVNNLNYEIVGSRDVKGQEVSSTSDVQVSTKSYSEIGNINNQKDQNSGSSYNNGQEVSSVTTNPMEVIEITKHFTPTTPSLLADDVVTVENTAFTESDVQNVNAHLEKLYFYKTKVSNKDNKPKEKPEGEEKEEGSKDVKHATKTEAPEAKEPIEGSKPSIKPPVAISTTPIPTINKKNEEPSNFICKMPRGRFADNKDCRKYYICIGKLQPVEGICPNNTVFSDLRKQCTKNLSHCVRNNQFQCMSVGRFSDYLNDNVYYICMKNKSGAFIRYKLQCQNGYYLNKTSVVCELNTNLSQSSSSDSTSSISSKSKSSSDSSSSTSSNSKSSSDGSSSSTSSSSKSFGDSSSSSSSSSDQSVSKSKKDESKSFQCEKEGKFADPNDCRVYYVCKKNDNNEFRRKRKKCSSDKLFHKDKKKCVEDDSYECE